MENIDIYDEFRNKTLKIKCLDDKLEKDEFRLAVHVIIFDKNNNMLIQKRTPNKRKFASMWDITCGGGSKSGETSKQSVHRELFEELGIDFDFSNARPYFTINFENGYDDFYIINDFDVDLSTLKLQESEVQEVKWASENEILTMINNGEFIPYYKSIIMYLFETRKNRGVWNLQ